MKLGMAGLGRMGANMALRLMRGGHEVVAYDPQPDAVRSIESEGALGAHSLEEMVERLTSPKAVWVMAPAGDPTETTIHALSNLLTTGDVVVDGGNAFYKDSMRRAAMLKEKGIGFLDSGGRLPVEASWGYPRQKVEEGYMPLMVGGDEWAYEFMLPALETLAPSGGVGLAEE